MTEARSWLHDVILVNDGSSIEECGNVDVFRTPSDMLNYIEPWWVEDNLGFALAASGEQLVLASDGHRIIIARRETRPDGKDIVRRWLHDRACHVLEARHAKAVKRKLVLGELEARGILPETIEGLIAYIGFTD